MEIPVEPYYPNTYQTKHYFSKHQKEIECVDKALKKEISKFSNKKNDIIGNQRRA